MVTLATAHPAKFPDAVERATGVRPPLPAHLADLFDRPERTATARRTTSPPCEAFVRAAAAAEARSGLHACVRPQPAGPMPEYGWCRWYVGRVGAGLSEQAAPQGWGSAAPADSRRWPASRSRMRYLVPPLCRVVRHPGGIPTHRRDVPPSPVHREGRCLMSVESPEALERSVLESKDREQLLAIASALGVKANSRDEEGRHHRPDPRAGPGRAHAGRRLRRNGHGHAAAQRPRTRGAPTAAARGCRRMPPMAAPSWSRPCDAERRRPTGTGASPAPAPPTEPHRAGEALRPTTPKSRPPSGSCRATGPTRPRRRRATATGEPRRQRQATAHAGAGVATAGDADTAASAPTGDRQGDGQQGFREDGQGTSRRRRRHRNRDRNRGDGPQGADRVQEGRAPRAGRGPELAEPVEVAGYLDLRDEGYGFLRVNGYLPSRDDVYVSVKQSRQFGLRKGDHVTGASRPGRPQREEPGSAARSTP